jgi:hypothetical protein
MTFQKLGLCSSSGDGTEAPTVLGPLVQTNLRKFQKPGDSEFNFYTCTAHFNTVELLHP